MAATFITGESILLLILHTLVLDIIMFTISTPVHIPAVEAGALAEVVETLAVAAVVAVAEVAVEAEVVEAAGVVTNFREEDGRLKHISICSIPYLPHLGITC